MSEAFFRTLAKQAAARYDRRDFTARRFALGKLTGDPVFRHLLERGLIAPAARVLDLGCGQGLLATLLDTARESHARGEWPVGWPAPRRGEIRGIDLRQRDVARARSACAQAAQFVCGDIRFTEFGAADAVVILDVLHYIDPDAQEEVLRRVRVALAKGGVLLLRVGDANGSLRFRYTVAVDHAVMALRGHRLGRFHCKPVAHWINQLESLGFTVEAAPMSAGTPFANVLLVARYDPRQPPTLPCVPSTFPHTR